MLEMLLVVGGSGKLATISVDLGRVLAIRMTKSFYLLLPVVLISRTPRCHICNSFIALVVLSRYWLFKVLYL